MKEEILEKKLYRVPSTKEDRAQLKIDVAKSGGSQEKLLRERVFKR